MSDSESWQLCEDNTMWLFGVALDLLLLGILTVQTYVYYLAFPNNRRLLKLAVTLAYLVGVAQTILAIIDLSNALQLGDYQENGCAAGGVNHFWVTVIVFGTVVALTAQWLYAYRIYVISHKWWIVIFVVCLSLGQMGTSIIGCVCLWKFSTQTVSLLALGSNNGLCRAGFGWVWGPLNFLCDITITVSMSILLLKRRKQMLKKTTHTHITDVIRLVVETGLVTSIVVVVYAVTYNFTATELALNIRSIWTIPGLAMGKVYSNSMLVLLNSRLTIVGGRNTGDPFVISDIRSEVLHTEVGEDQTTNAVTRHRTLNKESSTGST